MEDSLGISDINNVINQVIIDAASIGALVDRQTDSNFTRSGEYSYDWLVPYAFGNDFKILYKVEYVSNTGTYHSLHTCDAVWDELVDGDVAAALDTTYKVEGTGCLKLTVAAACAAADILATDNITSTDISDCDTIEIMIRSSVALAAGDIQLLLDNTASCASPVESIDIPATLANTTTVHVIDLANPHSDTAIISVGLKMITDKGAFVLYADRIKAVSSNTKLYVPLSNEYWFTVKGTTPKFSLTSGGLSQVGSDTQIRLTGYSAPDIFTDDATDSEIDPAYIIAKATGRLLISHAKSSYLDIHDRAKLATYWLGEASRIESRLVPTMPGDSREV